MPHAPRPLLACAAALACGLLAGCGGGSADRVLARVAGEPIAEADVGRLMVALAPEHRVPDPPAYSRCVARLRAIEPEAFASVLAEECAQRYRSLRRRALDLLIGSEWLLGEARVRGLRLSAAAAAVRRRLAQQRLGPLAGGPTHAELKRLAEAEVAAAEIRRRLLAALPSVGDAQVAAYYRRNIARYERPERRYIDIVERFPSRAAAAHAMAQPDAWARLAPRVMHEVVDRAALEHPLPGKRAAMRAIFAAEPHVLSGPIPLAGSYSVFELTRVVASRRTPLADVRSRIEAVLATARSRQALERFDAAMRRSWTERTSCARGYVVQRCRQYRGPLTAEDLLGSGG